MIWINLSWENQAMMRNLSTWSRCVRFRLYITLKMYWVKTTFVYFTELLTFAQIELLILCNLITLHFREFLFLNLSIYFARHHAVAMSGSVWKKRTVANISCTQCFHITGHLIIHLFIFRMSYMEINLIKCSLVIWNFSMMCSVNKPNLSTKLL